VSNTSAPSGQEQVTCDEIQCNYDACLVLDQHS